MNRVFFLLCFLVCLGQSACTQSARSEKSFDQIREMVSGKTQAEVKRLLGPPDTTEKLLLGDERWIWWDYTYLAGKSWAPEVRDKVVHLEITFEGPAFASQEAKEKGQLRVSTPYGVGFLIPGVQDDSRSLPLNKSTRSSV